MMDLLQSLSIIIASWVAIVGISAWRREYVGKRRIDLAEEALALFYEARDAIAFMRNPWSSTEEGATRKTRQDETADEKRVRDRAYVVFERYDKRSEVFNRLQAKRYRFLALFGGSTAKPFGDLGEVLHDIFSASHVLSDLWSEPPSTETERKHRRAEITKAERVIWRAGEDDPIEPRVQSIIEEIEATCRAIIDRGGSWKRFMDWVEESPRRRRWLGAIRGNRQEGGSDQA